jgi:hypothetical protein
MNGSRPGTALPVVYVARPRMISARESGAQIERAKNPTTLSAYGSLRRKHMNEPFPALTDKKASLEELGNWASCFKSEMSAVNFVDIVFTNVERPYLGRGSTMLSRMLKDGAIGFWELRARAREWDNLGLTPPADWIKALGVEIRGET